jgi:hypothetical protein
MSGSGFGRIAKRAAIPQENSGLTARCHDSFPKSEYQKLCQRIILEGRHFHLVQVVYGNDLT